MKNNILTTSFCFFAAVVHGLVCHGALQSRFANLDGCVLESPDLFRAGEPVSWRVTVTNKLDSSSRIDLAMSVHAVNYAGKALFPVFDGVSTNFVPARSSADFRYQLDETWYPTNVASCANIQIFAFLRFEPPGTASVAWIRPAFAPSTNRTESAREE